VIPIAESDRLVAEQGDQVVVRDSWNLKRALEHCMVVQCMQVLLATVGSLHVCFQCSKILLHRFATGMTDKSWMSCALSSSSNMIDHTPWQSSDMVK
jgi:hypothetical protein